MVKISGSGPQVGATKPRGLLGGGGGTGLCWCLKLTHTLSEQKHSEKFPISSDNKKRKNYFHSLNKWKTVLLKFFKINLVRLI